IFAAKHRESLTTLLKRHSFPHTLVTPGEDFSADGLKTGSGIRFWGDNTQGDLTALMKESQKKILIPVIQDPSQIRRISGMFRLEGGRRLSGTLTFVPSGASRDGLRKDLKFVNESIRRKLSALKVSHEGEVLEGNPGVTLKITVGDYTKAQPGLVKIQP
ncbi:MAG: hypothetical protein HY760_04995, partial [Nitrospirae bacterium]|nr:hypothetical protein [Nitrospirota bacterium]